MLINICQWLSVSVPVLPVMTVSHWPLIFAKGFAVLHGEVAVPCTCNPLQQGGIPVPGFIP